MAKVKKQAILIQIPNMDKYNEFTLQKLCDALTDITSAHLGLATTVVLFPAKIIIMDEGVLREMIETLQNTLNS